MNARCALPMLLLSLALCGCGGASEVGPYFGDARFLRFGVDPRVEADAVEAQLKRAGFLRVAQVEGPHHVALGFLDAATGRTAVRVVTARGTKLSLDSDSSPENVRNYALIVASALRGVSVLPADEVFVEVSGEREGHGCIAGFRVASDGTLARIVIDAGAVVADGCASEIQDADSDGAPELVVHAAFAEFASDEPPLVRVPLSSHGGGYRWVAGVGPVVAMLREQRGLAQQDLSAARRGLDVEAAFRSAVELAAIARFEGVDSGAQLKAFDEAVRGLVLTGRQAARFEHARQLIRQGWSSSSASEDSVELPAQEGVQDATETVPSDEPVDGQEEVPVAP